MVGEVITTVVWFLSGSAQSVEASGMLLLLWSLLRRLSGRNTRRCVLVIALTSCRSISLCFFSFSHAAQELLERICQRYRIHARIAVWEAHALVHRRLSFSVMCGVANLFVDHCLVSFEWSLGMLKLLFVTITLRIMR